MNHLCGGNLHDRPWEPGSQTHLPIRGESTGHRRRRRIRGQYSVLGRLLRFLPLRPNDPCIPGTGAFCFRLLDPYMTSV